MKFGNTIGVVIPLLLTLLIVFVSAQDNIDSRENLLRHEESMRVIGLLDKILAKLQDELEGKEETKDRDVEDITVQIQETESQRDKLNSELKETNSRLDYLESMRDTVRQDAEDAARSSEKVQKEIDLVKNIKKILVGNSLSSSCESDEDCQDGYTCDGQRCRVPLEGDCVASYECVAAAECIYGKCSSVVGRTCEVDNDCTSGTVCYDFKCKIDIGEQCSDDGHCYTGICERRRCKAPNKDGCTSSLHCQEGTVCEDNRCLLDRNQACTTHGDCATGYCAALSPETLESKVCRRNPCRSVSCPHSMVCDPFQGDCRVLPGGLCANTTQCVSNLVCQDEQCLARLNYECDSSENCISGLCYNGKCRLPSSASLACRIPDDCAMGECHNQRCAAGPYSYLTSPKTMGQLRISDNGTRVVSYTDDNAEGSALLDISNTRGRWYFEVKCEDPKQRCNGAVFGIAEHGKSEGVGGKYYGFRPFKADFKTHRNNPNYGDEKIQKGDIFGVDVDLDLGRIRFSKNGVYFGWQHDVEPGMYFPAIWDSDSGHEDNMNMTINTGFAPFAYPPPEKANRGWFGGFLGSQCFGDDDCSTDLVCRNAKCKLPVSSRCIDDASCASSYCVQNQCLYHLGESCDHNLQCASGSCRNHLCSIAGSSALNVRSQMGQMEVSEYRTRVSFTQTDNWEGTILGEVGNEAGRWYYEVTCIQDCRGISFGIASHSGDHEPSGRYEGWNPHHGRIRSSQGDYDYGSDYRMKDQDVAGVYVDLDNFRIGFTMNGVWKGWSRNMPSGVYYPAIWDNDGGEIADVRVNFGYYDFAYHNDPEFHRGWFGGSVLSTCRSNVDCNGNLVCHDARCRYPIKASCTQDKECYSPWCYSNKCVLKIGDSCSYGDECASGRCSHGRCSSKHYTTFDPSTAAKQASLSAGFTEVDMYDEGSVLANTANTYGKWYYEVECLVNNCRRLAAGIATAIGTNKPGGEYYALSFNHRCESNHDHHDFPGQNVLDGDVVGVAVDLETGKIGYYLNGAWLGWCYDNMEANRRYYPSVYSHDHHGGAAMVNFGYYPFHYDVPAGYNAGWFGGLLMSSCQDSAEDQRYACNTGLVCYQGYCRLPPSETCTHSDECTTSTCSNNKCVQLAGDRCDANAECATGICADGRCDTGPYAVWNPRAVIGGVVTKDMANTMVYSDSNSQGVMLGTQGKRSGRHYYEVECLDNCRGLYIGIATSTGSGRPEGKYMGYEPEDRDMFYSNGNDDDHHDYGSFGGNTKGETLGVYVDLDQRRMGVKQRNQWMGWFTHHLIEKLSDEEQYYPAVWDYDNGEHFFIRSNFGFYEWKHDVSEEYAHGWTDTEE